VVVVDEVCLGGVRERTYTHSSRGETAGGKGIEGRGGKEGENSASKKGGVGKKKKSRECLGKLRKDGRRLNLV